MQPPDYTCITAHRNIIHVYDLFGNNLIDAHILQCTYIYIYIYTHIYIYIYMSVGLKSMCS